MNVGPIYSKKLIMRCQTESDVGLGPLVRSLRSICLLDRDTPDKSTKLCSGLHKLFITSWLPGFARASPSLLLPPHSLLLSTLPPSDYPIPEILFKT